MGGVRRPDGRALAAGRLFRSEDLSRLTEDDVAALDRLGIRLVCDLRSPGERTRRRGAWPVGEAIEVLGLEGLDEARSMSAERFTEILGDATGTLARDYMFEVYADMPATLASGLAALFRRITDDDQVPVLIHCTAGKDRTGLVTSLLLLALGVDRDAVMQEYLRSDEHYGPDRVLRLMIVLADWRSDASPAPAAIDAMRAKPEYLEAALRAIDDRFGSLERYLELEGGLDEERRARLERALLTP